MTKTNLTMPDTSNMVHIIDDDRALRDALAFLMASRQVKTKLWASGEEFLKALPQPECACIILDIRLEGMSGLETYDQLRQAGCSAPVIFLTGHADVPIAVAALKAGAFDFVEKPFSDNQIVDLALAAIAHHDKASQDSKSRQTIVSRFATLSPRERDVLKLMLAGYLNKQIAEELNIAMRTVEVHRARILEKTAARNATELASKLAAADIKLS